MLRRQRQEWSEEDRQTLRQWNQQWPGSNGGFLPSLVRLHDPENWNRLEAKYSGKAIVSAGRRESSRKEWHCDKCNLDFESGQLFGGHNRKFHPKGKRRAKAGTALIRHSNGDGATHSIVQVAAAPVERPPLPDLPLLMTSNGVATVIRVPGAEVKKLIDVYVELTS